MPNAGCRGRTKNKKIVTVHLLIHAMSIVINLNTPTHTSSTANPTVPQCSVPASSLAVTFKTPIPCCVHVDVGGFVRENPAGRLSF